MINFTSSFTKPSSIIDLAKKILKPIWIPFNSERLLSPVIGCKSTISFIKANTIKKSF